MNVPILFDSRSLSVTLFKLSRGPAVPAVVSFTIIFVFILFCIPFVEFGFDVDVDADIDVDCGEEE